MTPERAVKELLGRVGSNKGEVVLLSEQELAGWPDPVVRSMKAAGLLALASPASSVTCPGCEPECSMPVHSRALTEQVSSFFVVCDKRDDISRIPIPEAMLWQWAASLTGMGAAISNMVGAVGTVSVHGNRCELGILRGRKHSSHLVLVADGKLGLHVAGHVVDLECVLTMVDGTFKLDRPALERLADMPRAGGGSVEGAGERKMRLAREVRVEKGAENRAFLKTVAAREGITTQRLKQLLNVKAEASPKPRAGRVRRSS